MSMFRRILSRLAYGPVVIAFGSIFGRPYQITGESMQETLNPSRFDQAGCATKVDGKKPGRGVSPMNNKRRWEFNDWVYVNYWARPDFRFERGDVVVMKSPGDHTQKFVKRVLAVEGDTIRPRKRPHKRVVIPPGHCWVESDNESGTSWFDSNVFGPVALRLIVGKATRVIWPPQRIRKLSNDIPSDKRISERLNVGVLPSDYFDDDFDDDDF